MHAVEEVLMRSPSSPLVSRRQLAQDLRRHRLAAGRTIEDVARHLECSAAKVSRMETGVVKVGVQDLKAMLTLYGVVGAEREEMLAHLREARTRGWWHEFSDVVPPRSATFYGLEDGASSISQHSTSLIPGLLQTEAYARALIASASSTPSEVVKRRIELRLRRQDLLQRAEPPQLDVILDEAVLHRRVGGPEVLAGQLRHLLACAERPAVTVRVVEFDAPAHPADGVTFTVFGFADAAAEPVVFREQLDSNGFIDDPAGVAVYTAALAAAAGGAADQERSHELIASCLRRLP
jgi:transcriptional regulator with XRE-family HTH domain